jgi:NADPH-dependent curcumin reductase CurA
VIASAGTDAKVEYMRSLGADVPFNYMIKPYASVLSKHEPIDVYWDNVGGEALEAAIEYAGLHARFVVRIYDRP